MFRCIHIVRLLSVLAQVQISAPTTTVQPLESLSFTATGGVEPYIFDLVADASGGSITVDGVYTAGAFDTPDGGDRIRATDKLGAVGLASVTVANLYIPPPPATGCGTTDDLTPLLGLFVVPMLFLRRRQDRAWAQP